MPVIVSFPSPVPVPDLDDTLAGDGNRNSLLGGSGNDLLWGGGGGDVLVGGHGDDSMSGASGQHDQASFIDSQSAVQADIAAGQASGDGNDTLHGIKDLYGSNQNDSLSAEAGWNEIVGAWGSDTEFGREGNDVLVGGIDFAFSDSGNVFDGGPGQDLCDFGNETNCEQYPPVTELTQFTTIEAPRFGQSIPANSFDRLNGEVSAGIFASDVKAQIAIRRLGREGCSWWNPQIHHLTRRPCSAALWTDAGRRTEGGGNWTYRLPTLLPPGEYRALARAVLFADCDKTKCNRYPQRWFQENLNLVDFELS